MKSYTCAHSSGHRALNKCWELAFEAVGPEKHWPHSVMNPFLAFGPSQVLGVDACDPFRREGSSGQVWLRC